MSGSEFAARFIRHERKHASRLEGNLCALCWAAAALLSCPVWVPALLVWAAVGTVRERWFR